MPDIFSAVSAMLLGEEPDVVHLYLPHLHNSVPCGNESGIAVRNPERVTCEECLRAVVREVSDA